MDVLTTVPLRASRVGHHYDVSTGRQFALWVLPVVDGLEPPELGAPFYPGVADLAYLHVVEHVRVIGDRILMRTVAHDVPAPPTLYFWPQGVA